MPQEVSEFLKIATEEMQGLKNLYPYSKNNDSYNKIIELCIESLTVAKEKFLKNKTNKNVN